MRYDEFKDAWRHALAESNLAVMGEAEERMDLRSTERSYSVVVEPVGRQDIEPFFVTAKLSWRWDALKTARSRTTEEDMLRELLGREETQNVETERPWLRVDLALRAYLPDGQPLPLPPAETWARWAHEAIGRLERIERLVPEEIVTEGKDGMLEVLAWQGEPAVKATCSPSGELKLEGVEVSAWQAINVPRRWDDSEQGPDECPDRQLAAMFRRVRASLHAWMEVMDHLLANSPVRRGR